MPRVIIFYRGNDCLDKFEEDEQIPANSSQGKKGQDETSKMGPPTPGAKG